MATLQFSAQIEEVKRNKDRTLRLKVDTQELPASESALLLELQDKQIWIALAETEITHNDIHIPEIIPEFKGEISPSKQQKNVLYRIWEQKTDQKQPFPDFYKSYMFKHIQSLKEKLN